MRRAALLAGVAACVFLAGRAFGSYQASAWGLIGIGLAVAAFVLAVLGRRPSRWSAVAAGLLVALGGWSLASVLWGGLPGEAWRTFDQALIAALALVVGSMLATSPGSLTVHLGVLAGVTAQAAEVFTRAATGHFPEHWFYQRYLDGPVGYHNAQAALLVLGVPLALRAAQCEPRLLRAAAAGSAGLLGSAVLFTQSRGALAALGIGVAVQILWARSLRIAAVAGITATAMVGLAFALKDVDAALLEGTAAERTDAVREYALWTALAIAALALLAIPRLRRAAPRSLSIATAVLLIAAVVGVSVAAGASLARTRTSLAQLTSDERPNPVAGATRLTHLSLNGRRDAWRVAWNLTQEAPLEGVGQGEFARRWTTERSLSKLYILQPHSIELELLSELGIVGLLLLAGAVGFAALALLTSSGLPASAAALGALVALLVQASVDWTWSFPALTASTLLVVGVAAGGTRGARPRLLVLVLIVLLCLAVVGSFAGPSLADRNVAYATERLGSDPDEAWRALTNARRLNPWNAAAHSLQGRLAEASGSFQLAADRYAEAARLSQRPWLDRFREARVLARLGAAGESRLACREALGVNPASEPLGGGPCAGDLLVSTSRRRVEAVALDGAALSGKVYIFATAPQRSEIQFFLDDPKMAGKPAKEERLWPYDLAGGQVETANSFDLTRLEAGTHTLVAAIEFPAGGRRIVRATFEVAGS